MKAWQIEHTVARLAPVQTALSYDNVGLLIGDAQKEITRVLLALDVTPETVAEAADFGAQMILSHHPVIFNPYRRITPESYDTAAAMAVIRQDMAALCMHTNLDLARGGVNDALAQALEDGDQQAARAALEAARDGEAGQAALADAAAKASDGTAVQQ